MKGSIKTKLDEQAYERDGYRCVECGEDAGIEAHHTVYGETLENLVTLCHACHKKRHGMTGCFVKGYDSRRVLNIENLRKANCVGHPFRGNQYTCANP